MEVKDVRVTLLNSDSGLKAIGSFSLDGAFAVRGIRIMEDKNGRNFVAFPSREKSNGEYEDIAFPLNKDLYHAITDAMINEYKSLLSETPAKDENKETTKEEAVNPEDTPFVENEQVKAVGTTKKGKSR